MCKGASMKDAAEILGEVVPKARECSKFARLIEPGKFVTNVDGRMYRVASRISGPDGIAAFKLANLQSESVPTPANFHPLAPLCRRRRRPSSTKQSGMTTTNRFAT